MKSPLAAGKTATGDIQARRVKERRGASGRKCISLANRLLQDMARNGLQPGDRLGTENSLAAEHDICRTTVRQALAILEKEGFVSRKQRLGTFVKQAVSSELECDRIALRGTVLLAMPESEGLDPEADLASFTIFRSMVSRLGELGFGIKVIPMNSNIGESRKQLAMSLRSGPIDGICAYSSNIEIVRDMIPNVPVVAVSTGRQDGGCWIGLDLESISCRLISHLLNHGHERIAIICGWWDDVRSFSTYIAGCRKAFQEVGLPFHRELLHRAHEGESIEDLAKAVLEGQNPTAIFAEEGRVCQAVITAANALNLTIPEDISIVACGQMAHQITSPVRITAIVPDNAAIGREAISHLVKIIDGEEPAMVRYKIEGPLVEGGSVARKSPSKSR